MSKKLYHFLLGIAIVSASAVPLSSQITCNPAGNLWVYTNYDGGVLNLSVDVNIPNIKIGVCTYEPVTINISGPYVGNVTEVRYAGYVSTTNNHCPNSPTTTTITGVPAGITSVNFLPPSTLSNPNGNASIVCAYSCSTTSNQGGCNTADQIKSYFQASTGGTLVSYYTQYGCWAVAPRLLSAGGNCCNSVPSCFIVSNAGSDVQICAGDQTTLSGSATGGATVYSWSPTAGLGNPNSATTTASPTITTTYVLTAGNGASCSDLDTVVVTVNPLPVVALGADTMLCGGTLVLDAGNAGMNFLWSDNSTAQTLNATASGTYNVSVTNTTTGCTNADTITVTFNTPPTVALGNDTSFCNSLLLDAGNAGMTYLWSDNSTQQTLNATQAGTYSVVVTDGNGCTATDAITLTLNTPPAVALGNDTAICGDHLILDAGNPGMTYLWSNSTTQQTTTAFITGTYSVVVTDANGCTGTDAINITFNQIPVVTFTTAVPVVCLADQAFPLTTGSPSGGTYSGTGVTAGSFDPQLAGIGTYAITYTFTDSAGCTSSATDSLTVDACLGIVNNAAVGVMLFPNPANEVLNIVFDRAATGKMIYISDVTGRVVYAENSNGRKQITINIQDLSSGIYFVNAGGTTMKFVKE